MRVMAMHQGSDWSVHDFVCEAKPGDRPYQEVHKRHALAFVKQGSFGCNTLGRTHELVAGAVFVARPGREYVATHEHHDCGDECLVVDLSPALAESLGMGKRWDLVRLPPLPETMVAGELLRAAVEGRSDVGVDEAALGFVHKAACAATQRPLTARPAAARDRRRAVEAARWLEENLAQEVDLEQAAREAGLSPFHFLRTFSQALGVTPHQYLVRMRLRKAARLLAASELPVTDVALDSGFADLSNFIRTFRRAAGATPSAFRRAAQHRS